MAEKPTKEALTERVIIPMSKALIDKIEGYRRAGDRIPSRAEAVRELIEAGIEAKKAAPK